MVFPKHIALIMDGNSRWAQKQSRKPIDGHKQGLEALRLIVEHCAKIGVKYLTAFAFSSENWKRSAEEVSDLMELFVGSLDQEAGQLAENDIAVRFIGERDRFDETLQQMMTDVENQLDVSTQMTLSLALDYGGRRDIVNASRRIAEQVQQGTLLPEEIDETLLAAHVALADIPEPDLCIRTSNEQRISNFLLWQMAYTELYFSPVLWPDFTPKHIDLAIDEFSKRKRRYGTSSVPSL